MSLPPLAKVFFASGALAAMLAVAAGAFGAHALKSKLSAEMLAVYHTAAQYHFYHALALCLVGLTLAYAPSVTWLRAAGWLMLAGIVLFSGSLYALSLSSIEWLGAITPIGGVFFLLAWLALVLGVLRA